MKSNLSSSRNNGINPTHSESGVALGMRVLPRVPQKLRDNKEHLYNPSIMSFGPYQYHLHQLRLFEQFKEKMAMLTLKEEERRLLFRNKILDRTDLFRNKILDRIDDIRHFYEGLSKYAYKDDVLADMMLRDSSTLLFFMEYISGKVNSGKYVLALRELGPYQIHQSAEDIVKLDNQIPWWLMRSLISFSYDDDKKGKEMIRRFLSFHAFGKYEDLKQIPWNEDGDGDEYNSLHLLEAIRNTSPIVTNMTDFDCKKSSSGYLVPCLFRSVRELKAKGIYFEPTSHFLGKMTFSSHYSHFYGVLRLPVLVVSRDKKVAFSNIVALEMSKVSCCYYDTSMTSYLALMKSMIQSSEDAKLLQEKGIIVSFLDNNEEIVRMFREMDTFGVGMLPVPVYDDIKIRINEYCDRKAKTWMADLFKPFLISSSLFSKLTIHPKK